MVAASGPCYDRSGGFPAKCLLYVTSERSQLHHHSGRAARFKGLGFMKPEPPVPGLVIDKGTDDCEVLDSSGLAR
jgi:hypothetical protein